MSEQGAPRWTCDGCRRSVTRDGGAYVSYSDIHRYEDEYRAWDKASAEVFGPLVIRRTWVGMPSEVRWHVYHWACDPAPDATDYALDIEHLDTWQGIVETMVHLTGKAWFDWTDWGALMARIGVYGKVARQHPSHGRAPAAQIDPESPAGRRAQFAKMAKGQRFRILERGGFRCHYCGARDDLQIDHVVPLAKGGTNDPANLVPACMDCNYGKRDRLVALPVGLQHGTEAP